MTHRTSWRKVAIACGVAALVLALFSSLLFAAGKMQKFNVEGYQVSRKPDGKFYITTFTDAIVTHEDATFTANTIVVKSEGNVHEITCTGNPVFIDPENRITGDKVTALSTPRQAEFVGNVKMVSTPKKKDDVKGDLRGRMNGEPSTLTCEKLSYFYSAKNGVAKGNVMIVQKARTVWADEATYDQNLELVTMKGNIRMKNTGDEELKNMSNAETVTVSLQNDWVDMLAKKGSRVMMEFDVQDEEPKQPAAGTKPAEGAKPK